MLKQLGPGLRLTLVLTVFTGLVYPGLVTGLCQVLFREQANGSLVVQDGKVIGSRLIGQVFSKPEYFHSRPSAVNYDASASSGSNLGSTSQKLIDRVKGDLEAFRKNNPEFTETAPADLLTASSSGLDPHISPASAMAQVARVAAARKMDVARVRQLVESHTEGRTFGILGEPRVNVLELNLALDK
jgi:K+-transporting ATPase ATPase C chain